MEDNNNGEETSAVDNGGALMAENVDEEVESMVTWLYSMDNVVDDDTGDYDDDDDATELSKVLEASAEEPFETKVKIIDNPPRWHPLIFQTAASYVTINGNEESCGSSFSDSDTSYMAGISCCGLAVVGDGGAWDCVTEEVARGWIGSEECLVSGGGASGGGYCDDEMLERFLGGGSEIDRRR